MRIITWDSFSADVQALTNQINESSPTYDLIIGIMRGGCVPACMISHALNTPMLAFGVKSYTQDRTSSKIEVYQSFISDLWDMKNTQSVDNVLVVDDLSDTGNTFEYFLQTYHSAFKIIHTAAPYIKSNTRHRPMYYTKEFAASDWLEFPWEAIVKQTK